MPYKNSQYHLIKLKWNKIKDKEKQTWSLVVWLNSELATDLEESLCKNLKHYATINSLQFSLKVIAKCSHLGEIVKHLQEHCSTVIP